MKGGRVKLQIPSISIKKDLKILRIGFLLAFSSLALFSYSLGFAADLSFIGGGEIDTRGQGFSYLGIDLTKKVYRDVSISGRVIPNYLTYKFRSGNEKVKAASLGIYTVAGIKLSLNQTTIGLFGGTEYRHTDLRPDVGTAEVKGNTFAGVVQGELDTWLSSRTNFNLFSSFSGTDNFFYERGRIKQQITNLDFKKPNTINVGVEQFYGRNPDFRQLGGGLILELFNIPKEISFAVRVGYKHDSTFGSGTYGGLELYIHLNKLYSVLKK
jgi:hypothetical protein